MNRCTIPIQPSPGANSTPQGLIWGKKRVSFFVVFLNDIIVSACSAMVLRKGHRKNSPVWVPAAKIPERMNSSQAFVYYHFQPNVGKINVESTVDKSIVFVMGRTFSRRQNSSSLQSQLITKDSWKKKNRNCIL